MKKFALIIFLITLWVARAGNAQQNHYWATQYGARSSLMGGAVIAGVNDNSAVYYNPAALVSLENAVSLNANLYQLSWFDVKNGLGTDINVNSFSLDLYPQFAGGTVSFKNPRFKIGYTLMTRSYHYLKMDARHEKFYDAIPATPGNEEFIGSFDYLSRANEQWVGLGLAYQATDKFAIGLTQFLAYRFQNYRTTFVAEAVSTDLDNFYTASVRNHFDMSFDNLKIIWKLGMTLDLAPWKLGLTITAPSLNINPFNLSTGRARRETSASNLSIGLPDPEFENFLATDKQSKIPSLHKYPMSIGVGIEYHTSKTRLALATEYFHKIDQYKVLSPQSRPVIRPSNVFRNFPIDDFLVFSHQAAAIANLALGLEQRINDQWSVLAGFRTDFNAYNNNVLEIDDSFDEQDVSYWDLYHLSAGATFHKKQSDITVGLSYYFGVSADNTQYANFDTPLDRNYFADAVNNSANTTTRSISLIVGYTHYLRPRKR